MEQIEYIAGCIVRTYELKNDDIYGSNINEMMLDRRHRAVKLDQKCDLYSPLAYRALKQSQATARV